MIAEPGIGSKGFKGVQRGLKGSKFKEFKGERVC